MFISIIRLSSIGFQFHGAMLCVFVIVECFIESEKLGFIEDDC